MLQQKREHVGKLVIEGK